MPHLSKNAVFMHVVLKMSIFMRAQRRTEGRTRRETHEEGGSVPTITITPILCLSPIPYTPLSRPQLSYHTKEDTIVLTRSEAKGSFWSRSKIIVCTKVGRYDVQRSGTCEVEMHQFTHGMITTATPSPQFVRRVTIKES